MVIGGMSAFVGGRSPVKLILFLPIPIMRDAASPAIPLPLHFIVLIEPPRVFTPLNVQPQTTEIYVLQSLPRLLGTPLTIELHKSISVLNFRKKIPADLSCSYRRT